MIENNENTEESNDSSEIPQEEEDGPKSPTPPPARNSPEPNCAICLEKLQNRAFTDSCFHMFCFTCLHEWSKVKPECPLCKKSFKSIVHNVRSFKEYDQYFIPKTKLARHVWQISTERRMRFTTTVTTERLMERSRIESEIALHRMRYAPHAVQSHLRMVPSSVTARRTPSPFRQRIYEEDLWVKPIASTRLRCTSPSYIRGNISFTQRLLPWLNREIPIVMSCNEAQISFMIDLILSLIVRHEITSYDFYHLLEPYIRTYTSHFIHEFYNFASSPYETMEAYDLHAQYSTLPFEPVEEDSSPDSDVIPIETSESSSQMSTSSDSAQKRKCLSKKKTSNESKKLKKIILKRNTKNNCWESIVPPSPFGSYGISDEHSRPSTSRTKSALEHSMEASRAMIDESPTVSDDDECQVVDVLKPRHERATEIVDLSGEDEEMVVDMPKDDDDNSNDSVQETTLKDTSDDDDDIIFISEVEASSEEPDTPIDYSLKASRRLAKSESKNETHPDHSCSSSSSPIMKIRKMKACPLDSISTDSSSEGAEVPEKETKVKKRKLRNVGAHFSKQQDSSRPSTSSSKKQKERKKKDHKKKG